MCIRDRPTYLEEIAVSLLPIIVMFGIFQFVALHMDCRSLGRIAVGLEMCIRDSAKTLLQPQSKGGLAAAGAACNANDQMMQEGPL